MKQPKVNKPAGAAKRPTAAAMGPRKTPVKARASGSDHAGQKPPVTGPNASYRRDAAGKF
jgi:hypothetical protein